jgi:hypothetical protein
VTVPVGNAADPVGPATVAVNVTAVLATDGFGLAASVVVVGCLMLSIRAAEVAAPFWVSPP